MCIPAAGSWTPGSSSPDFGVHCADVFLCWFPPPCFIPWFEVGRNSNSWTTTNHLKSCLLNQRVIFASNYSWDPTSGKYQTNMTDDGFGASFSTKVISVRMSMLKLRNSHSCVMYMWSTASSPDLLAQVFVSLPFSAHFTHFKFLSVSALHFLLWTVLFIPFFRLFKVHPLTLPVFLWSISNNTAPLEPMGLSSDSLPWIATSTLQVELEVLVTCVIPWPLHNYNHGGFQWRVTLSCSFCKFIPR